MPIHTHGPKRMLTNTLQYTVHTKPLTFHERVNTKFRQHRRPVPRKDVVEGLISLGMRRFTSSTPFVRSSREPYNVGAMVRTRGEAALTSVRRTSFCDRSDP